MTRNQIAVLGALLADHTRAEILCTLMDGRAHTGGELARHIGVSPSTISEHLSKLQDGQMVIVEPQGRHRYFRLASAEVAALLETLGAAANPIGAAMHKAPAALLYARTCYDHLAGELAVHIHDQLLADGHLHHDDDHHHLGLTPSGAELMAAIGVDVDAARAAKRPTVRGCLDWTQRRHHLAGSVAAGMLDAFLAQQWVTRGVKPRVIQITDTGRVAIRDHFNLATDLQSRLRSERESA